MNTKAKQKKNTRKCILAAAERCFKKNGYSGSGVDGLAKEAGVTSGAFYGHFKSKEDVFKSAITSGMEELKLVIESLQQEHGEKWWKEFAKFYMGQKRTCDLTESCALQSLTPEVGRSGEAIHTLFETELLKIVSTANEKDPQKADKTWASMAMLIGGVTLARAVADKDLSNEIARAVKSEVISIHNDEIKR